MDYDIFNGDADGLCALVQLRLAEPRPNALLVTGPKRDIELLARVSAAPGDRVTVLDISMRRNRAHLLRILGEGAHVIYADHHDPGAPLEHPNLARHIVTRGEMCTSAIVDTLLGGAHRAWAVVGAFGDNMRDMAARLAEGQGLDLGALEELGTLLNYNGYGTSLEDLPFHPDALFKLLVAHPTPQDFLATDTLVMPTLRERFRADMGELERADVRLDTPGAFAVALPDSPGARRASGFYANRLANTHPHRAHAVLTERADGWGVSIRAPISTRRGAAALAKRFGGGGREAAAGVDGLRDVPAFLEAFGNAYPSRAS